MCVAEDHWSRPEQVIDVLAALGVPEIRAAPFLHHELEPVAAAMAAEHAARQHPVRAPDEIPRVAGRHTCGRLPKRFAHHTPPASARTFSAPARCGASTIWPLKRKA